MHLSEKCSKLRPQWPFFSVLSVCCGCVNWMLVQSKTHRTMTARCAPPCTQCMILDACAVKNMIAPCSAALRTLSFPKIIVNQKVRQIPTKIRRGCALPDPRQARSASCAERQRGTSPSEEINEEDDLLAGEELKLFQSVAARFNFLAMSGQLFYAW